MAASAASSSGSSSRLVTCAWLLGVRRTRILEIAICSSTGRRRATTRASFSGVAPAARRTTAARAVPGSTIRRANATSSRVLASSATTASMPRAAMKASMRSKSAAGVPSSSPRRPRASSATEGPGSFAEANATSPASSSRSAKPSRLTGRLSSASKRPRRRASSGRLWGPRPRRRAGVVCLGCHRSLRQLGAPGTGELSRVAPQSCGRPCRGLLPMVSRSRGRRQCEDVSRLPVVTLASGPPVRHLLTRRPTSTVK